MKRILGALVVLVVAVFGLQMIAAESGEVVILRTFVGEDVQERRLWVVEDRGVSWLRAGQPTSSWYQRLLQNPDLQLERGSELYEYRGFPVQGGPTVDRINALMLQKYGWADEYIGMLFDRSDAVAIRLDPR